MFHDRSRLAAGMLDVNRFIGRERRPPGLGGAASLIATLWRRLASRVLTMNMQPSRLFTVRKRLQAAVCPAVALLAVLCSSARSAFGCGVSASGVASCSLLERSEQTRPRWAVGVNYLYTSTRLRFSGGLHGDETRWATLAVLAYLPTPSLVLQVAAGVSLDGSLTLPEGKHDFSPGPIGSLGLDWQVWDDGQGFALLTSSLSFAATRTRFAADSAIGYQALDVRLGGQLGVELLEVLRPYALARVFGGPVFWRHAGEDVTGTDTHHFQVGGGLALRIARTWSMFAEGVPLGERALAAGVATVF